MTKADREALLSRVGECRLYSDERIADFCSREIDRAVRREQQRAAKVWCHDCGDELIYPGPDLCEMCVSRRYNEGMSRDDKRKISTWRRT